MRRLLSFVLLTGCSAAVVRSGSSASTGGGARVGGDDVAIPAPGAVWFDEGPLTWPARPTTPEITANDLRSRLYPLSHDSMEGRRVGEESNHRATAWIAAEFRRLGLRPAGDSGTFFQNLPYGTMAYDAASVRLAVGGVPLAVQSDWVPLSPFMGGGIGGKGELVDVPVVFAGRWGDSTALDAASLRGKVAVFSSSPNAPGAEQASRAPATLPRCDSVPDMFGAAAAARVEAERRAGRLPPAFRPTGGVAPAPDARARNAGAVGVILVANGSIPASAVSAAFAARGMMQPSSTPSLLPGVIVSRSAAEQLFGRGLEGLSIGTTGKAVTATWDNAWRMSPTPARNVIAVLPGSDPARASEYVLVGAHSDHVGTNATAVDHDSLRAVNMVTRRQGANDPQCRPTAAQQRRIDSLITRARSIRAPRRDSVMNGADDDGSGIAVMLEIAEKFASTKPRRSIVFIAHQGEEAGLLGSFWFTDHPTLPLDKVVAAHNMDMVGKGRVEYVKFGGPHSIQMLGARRLSREFGDIIDSVNAVRAVPMAIDKTWEVRENPLNRFCRSDQVSYVRKNVPVTYFSTGYALDYHQATDEPQYIDYEHSARVGRFLFDVMWAIAERRDRPAIAGADTTMPNCR